VDVSQADPALVAELRPLLLAHRVYPQPAGQVAAILAALGPLCGYQDAATALRLFKAVIHEAGTLSIGVWRLKQLAQPGGWSLAQVLTPTVRAALNNGAAPHPPAEPEADEADSNLEPEPEPEPALTLTDGTTQPVARLWHRTLTELELQMTRATFDTWLRDSTCIGLADATTLIVQVKNQYAVEWLENRLAPVIQRTLQRLVGQELGVHFVAAGPPASPG